MLLFVMFIGCTDKETIKLDNYLKSYNYNINDYKVICIVPVEGCGYCIDSSLKYAQGARNDFLLIMSARFKKSLDITSERLNLAYKKNMIDSINSAYDAGLVSEFSPCYYFLRYGEVVKKVDLSKFSNKNEIFDEVEQFFIEEDINLRQMQLLMKKTTQ